MSRFVRFALALSFAAPAVGAPVRWTPAPLATGDYESSPSFTPDGREVFFMRSDTSFRNYRLLHSRCGDGRWSRPAPPPFALPPPVLEGDPSVSADGRRVYFISSRRAVAEGRGNEDLDIWFVERDANGDWSTAAQRLPEPVNSTSAELLPRVVADGRLYFGSDRPGGQGGNDWLVVVADRGDRSHLYRYRREGDAWVEVDRIDARADVFQVGPLLSPRGDRVLFAQATADASGEIFVSDLAEQPDAAWPPSCVPR